MSDEEHSHIKLRTAAVIACGGSVLLHRRVAEAVWALPGGRVEAGESAAEALVREVREELGQAVQVGELLFVVENHFIHGGVRRHEVGLYFRAELAFSPEPSDSGPFAGAKAALEFCWFSRAELEYLPLRPSFLTSALAKPSVEFAHVVVGLPSTEV